jgi:ribonuclease VapC
LIIVDTSALICILLREPGADTVAAKLMAARKKFISPMSVVEATMVLARVHPDPKPSIDAYLARGGVDLCVVDDAHVSWAQHAFLTFGKGRHPARLDLGDCFSYAAAKSLDAPLLYIGDDFAKTDIRAA